MSSESDSEAAALTTGQFSKWNAARLRMLTIAVFLVQALKIR